MPCTGVGRMNKEVVVVSVQYARLTDVAFSMRAGARSIRGPSHSMRTQPCEGHSMCARRLLHSASLSLSLSLSLSYLALAG